MNELESQLSHYDVLVSDCLGVIGECQKDDPVIAGRGNERQVCFGRLTRGRQERSEIDAVQ